MKSSDDALFEVHSLEKLVPVSEHGVQVDDHLVLLVWESSPLYVRAQVIRPP